MKSTFAYDWNGGEYESIPDRSCNRRVQILNVMQDDDPLPSQTESTDGSLVEGAFSGSRACR